MNLEESSVRIIPANSVPASIAMTEPADQFVAVERTNSAETMSSRGPPEEPYIPRSINIVRYCINQRRKADQSIVEKLVVIPIREMTRPCRKGKQIKKEGLIGG